MFNGIIYNQGLIKRLKKNPRYVSGSLVLEVISNWNEVDIPNKRLGFQMLVQVDNILQVAEYDKFFKEFVNYNGNPPWGGGTGAGQGGLTTAQGRYPSALGTADQPLAIWNEYAANPQTNK